MSKTLSSSLGIDLAGLAQLLRKKGRGNDTMLAHITPKEAALLKRRGGSGTINPDTGLPEFNDSGENGGGASSDTGGYLGGDQTQFQQTNQDTSAPVQDQSNVQSAIQTDTGISSPYSASANYNPSEYLGGAPVDQSVSQPAINEAQIGGGAGAPGASTSVASGGGNWWDDTLKAAGGVSGILGNLAKAGVLGGIGAVGASQANKAAQQGQVAAGQIGAMAAPVQARSDVAQQQLRDIAAQTQAQGQTSAQAVTDLGKLPLDVGTQMVQQAQSGTLTPANMQALEALKAQTQQGISNRGGVGAMQAGVAEQTARATLGQQQLNQGLQTYQQGAAYGLTAEQIKTASNTLANNLRTAAINTGLTQSGIADQYTQQAIMIGLQSDQQLAANMQKFYSTLASIGFSTAMKPTTTNG
jgi:hypothetical protein